MGQVKSADQAQHRIVAKAHADVALGAFRHVLMTATA